MCERDRKRVDKSTCEITTLVSTEGIKGKSNKAYTDTHSKIPTHKHTDTHTHAHIAAATATTNIKRLNVKQ